MTDKEKNLILRSLKDVKIYGGYVSDYLNDKQWLGRGCERENVSFSEFYQKIPPYEFFNFSFTWSETKHFNLYPELHNILCSNYSRAVSLQSFQTKESRMFKKVLEENLKKYSA